MDGLTKNNMKTQLSVLLYYYCSWTPLSNTMPQSKRLLTLSPPNKLSSATFLFCFNFQSASMSFKICKNVVWVSNSLDPGEMLSYSASHPDPSCFAYGTIVLLGGLRVKTKLERHTASAIDMTKTSPFSPVYANNIRARLTWKSMST